MKVKPGFLKKAASLLRKLPKTGLVSSFLLIIIVLATWVFLKSMTQPSKGIIKPTAATSAEPKISYDNYEGKHVVFSFSQAARMDINDKLPPSVLESYWIARPGTPKNPAWYIAVTVYKLPGSSPEENSSYKIRLNSPEIYKKSTETMGSKQVTYFNNEKTGEIVAFIQRADLLGAVALTGNSQDPLAISDFKHILSSWSWK